MGLFDDLLKKPSAPATDSGSSGSSGDDTSGSGGANPPISDPLAAASAPMMAVSTPPAIQKTEEISIVTESAHDTAASMPPPVTAHAVDDASSILVGGGVTPTAPEVQMDAPIIVTQLETPTVSNPTPIQAQEIDLGHLFGEAPRAEVGPVVTETPAVETPVQSVDTESPIIDILGSPETDTHSIVSAPVEPVSTESISTESPLIDASEAPVETSSPTQYTETPLVSEQEQVTVVEDSTDSTESVADIAPEETALIESPLFAEMSTPAADLYEHPSDFIQASIDRIDAMIVRIDTAHGSKLSEALGYKTEKEKYTLLEEQAYADAEQYVTEKDHALSMRSYFEEQLRLTASSKSTLSEPTADITDSVETALTGIAVQTAVTDTVETPRKGEKTKKRETAEEPVGILGL